MQLFLRNCNSSHCSYYNTGLMIQGLNPGRGKTIICSCEISRLSLGSTQVSVGLKEFLSWGVGLTAHLHVVLRLKSECSYTSASTIGLHCIYKVNFIHTFFTVILVCLL
jgi:hypothetical protein